MRTVGARARQASIITAPHWQRRATVYMSLVITRALTIDTRPAVGGLSKRRNCSRFGGQKNCLKSRAASHARVVAPHNCCFLSFFCCRRCKRPFVERQLEWNTFCLLALKLARRRPKLISIVRLFGRNKIQLSLNFGPTQCELGRALSPAARPASAPLGAQETQRDCRRHSDGRASCCCKFGATSGRRKFASNGADAFACALAGLFLSASRAGGWRLALRASDWATRLEAARASVGLLLARPVHGWRLEAEGAARLARSQAKGEKVRQCSATSGRPSGQFASERASAEICINASSAGRQLIDDDSPKRAT